MPYRGRTGNPWRSPTTLLKNLSHWKPDYLILDTKQTSERRAVEKLVDEGRIHVGRVHINGLKRLRVYRFKEPAQFSEKSQPGKTPADSGT